MTFEEITFWIAVATDVLTFLGVSATFATVWIAWRALRSWQDQLHGQTYNELGRQVLRDSNAVIAEFNKVYLFAIGARGKIGGLEAKTYQSMAVDHFTQLQNRIWTLEASVMEAEAIMGLGAVEYAKKLTWRARDDCDALATAVIEALSWKKGTALTAYDYALANHAKPFHGEASIELTTRLWDSLRPIIMNRGAVPPKPRPYELPKRPADTPADVGPDFSSTWRPE